MDEWVVVDRFSGSFFDSYSLYRLLYHVSRFVFCLVFVIVVGEFSDGGLLPALVGVVVDVCIWVYKIYY